MAQVDLTATKERYMATYYPGHAKVIWASSWLEAITKANSSTLISVIKF